MINFRVKKDMCPTHISIQLTFNKFVEFCRTIVATNSVKSIVFFIPTLYNDVILFKGNLCERRCEYFDWIYVDMASSSEN